MYKYTAHYIPEGASLVEEINNMASQGWRLVANPEVTQKEVNGKVVTTAVAWFEKEVE